MPWLHISSIFTPFSFRKKVCKTSPCVKYCSSLSCRFIIRKIWYFSLHVLVLICTIFNIINTGRKTRNILTVQPTNQWSFFSLFFCFCNFIFVYSTCGGIENKADFDLTLHYSTVSNISFRSTSIFQTIIDHTYRFILHEQCSCPFVRLLAAC